MNEEILRRNQIRETIKTHLERERQLFARGIKVLSLFFIDHVDSYRIYDKDNVEKGKFAKMFEEEYQRALQEFMPTFTDASYTRFLSARSMRPKTFTMVTSLSIKKGRAWNRRIRKAKTKNVVSTLS